MKESKKDTIDYDCGCTHVKKLTVVVNSQFYTNLDMIKHSLEIMKGFYKTNDVPTDFTFDHMIKGIENTMEKGYILSKV